LAEEVRVYQQIKSDNSDVCQAVILLLGPCHRAKGLQVALIQEKDRSDGRLIGKLDPIIHGLLVGPVFHYVVGQELAHHELEKALEDR
jgi:hypothetical protein